MLLSEGCLVTIAEAFKCKEREEFVVTAVWQGAGTPSEKLRGDNKSCVNRVV